MIGQLALSPELICSGSRKKRDFRGAGFVGYLAVEETGHKATDVAGILGIKGASVYHEAKKGKKSSCAVKSGLTFI